MNAISFTYDHKTNNISFLKMFTILKSLGVNNNKFFLKLHDETLMGVDPHNPSLSDDNKKRIINEALINPWYYLRECVRMPVPGGVEPFSLNIGTLAMIFVALQGVDQYTILPRQNRRDSTAIALIGWAMNGGNIGTNFGFHSTSFDNNRLNVDKMLDIDRELPDYMQGHKSIKISKDRVDNPVCRNRMKIHSSARTKDHADTLGRGMDEHIQFIHEAEYIKNIGIIIDSSTPVFYNVKNEAKRAGKLAFRIFTSTPNDDDDPSSKVMLQIINRARRFHHRMFDLSSDELVDCINTQSVNNIVYIQYDYLDLGHNDKWFEYQCRSLNNDPVKIDREILLKGR